MARIRFIAWSLIFLTSATVAFAGKEEEEAAPFDIRYPNVSPHSLKREHIAANSKLQESLGSSYSLQDAIKGLLLRHQSSEIAEILRAVLTQAKVSIADIGNDHSSLPILHLAVMRNELEVIKVLFALDRETVRNLLFSQTLEWDGASFKHVGETALALAVHRDRVEAAKLILVAANEQGAARDLIEVRIHRSTMGKQTVSTLFFYYVSEEMQKVLNLNFPENAELQNDGFAALNDVLKATGLDQVVRQLQIWGDVQNGH